MTVSLIILDGFGINPNPKGNAINAATTPNINTLWSKYPNTTLLASGNSVGLPDEQWGNSEVGHLTIGGGRILKQYLTAINEAFDSQSSNLQALENLTRNLADKDTIHLMGLFSYGGVHSWAGHVYSLLKILSLYTKNPIALHLITDGRDCAQKSAEASILELQNFLAEFPNVHISTLCGRYYSMDRDKRWDRTKKAFELYAHGVGISSDSPLHAVRDFYSEGITDEFFEPTVFKQWGGFKPNDAIIFWNFREDRMRQIVSALCLESFLDFPRDNPPFKLEKSLSFTKYDDKFNFPVIFPPISVPNHLGEVISRNNFSQLRVAETEKYAHVTYFFNGGIENPFSSEDRILIPSVRDVSTYDLKPEMSAFKICDAVIEGIKKRKYTLIVANFANLDMVGHTGNFDAVRKATEVIDQCVGELVEAMTKYGSKAIFTSDHGNAEQMINYDDMSPHTSHTLHPVPFILFGFSKGVKLRANGNLSDISPTILDLLSIEKPKEMTGETLILKPEPVKKSD